ncbi:MAG: ABC transporter substrate-binding protein [candidate division NC10 bacterium]|nr:ABC transporter substrate-binding protein [candidate division NC10 bacterium]
MKRRHWTVAGLSVLVLLVSLVTPPGADAQCALGVPVIRLGVQGSSSGSHADYGRQIMMGSTMAVEEINAAGGILGCKLEMKFVDEELKPASAVKNVRYLVTEWGAHFLYGVDSSGSSMAIIKEIVRVAVPVYQDAILPALIFKDRPELKRFATIGSDYEYGYSTWSMFKETMKKFRPDAEFVAAAWAPFWTMDFSSHISAVMAEKPDVIIATPWAGEAVMLLRQAMLQGVFDRIHVWWQAMGGSVDVLEGITREVQQDKFKGKLWATARYIHNWPDTPENKAFIERFDKRWGRLPNYSAETTYSAIYITKAAVEKAKSLETAKVLEALKGMQIQTPAGLRVFRTEDHQFIYNVPAGRVVWDPKYPIAVLGDLKVVPAKEYYRHPPFTPVALTK